MPLIRLLAAGLLLAAAGAAQTHDKNPFSSKEAFEEGKRLYRLNCGVCHGMEGRSGRGARLAVKKHRHGNTDKELYDIIANGIPGTEMPGLWLPEESIWKILLFVRSFEENAGEACPLEPGNAARGREIYFEKGGCSTCHTIGMGGGRLGPDLSYVGVTLGRAQLRDALVEPQKDISRRYQTVRVTTNRGGRVEGILLNETAYTLHLMDREENFRYFDKAELQSIEKPPESLMPAYGELLSEAEMNDLLAYLCSLRGPVEEASE